MEFGGKVTQQRNVVFDASAKTTNAQSLNDMLLVGPNIQQRLASILIRWSIHKYVFLADIEKIYRQITVSSHDQKYQKILWRFSTNDPIQEFYLKQLLMILLRHLI